jgi:hypothetical protein
MGKAAENERLKLRATWYNNISVGLTVAGVAIPYLTVPQRFTMDPKLVASGRLQEAVGAILLIFVPFVITIFLAFYFRFGADAEVASLQD